MTISESQLLEILNAQPFSADNNPVRIWQLFRDDVHVGDAIKAILAEAGFAALEEYKTAAGMLAIEKAELRRENERLHALMGKQP